MLRFEIIANIAHRHAFARGAIGCAKSSDRRLETRWNRGMRGHRVSVPISVLPAILRRHFSIGTGFSNANEWYGHTANFADGDYRYGWTEVWNHIGGESRTITNDNDVIIYDDDNGFFFNTYHKATPNCGDFDLQSGNYNQVLATPAFETRPLAAEKYQDKMIGIEYHFKLEHPAGAYNGEMGMWLYDQDGIPQKMQQSNTLVFRPDLPAAVDDKMNRILIEGNKADAASTGIKFECGPNMECGFYMDDFIVDEYPIGNGDASELLFILQEID